MMALSCICVVNVMRLRWKIDKMAMLKTGL